MNHGDPSSVPIISFRRDNDDDDNIEELLAAEIINHLTTRGYFYAVDHGIPADLLSSAFDAAKTGLFAAAERNVFHFGKEDRFLGYKPLKTSGLGGDEIGGDYRESVNFSADRLENNVWQDEAKGYGTIPNHHENRASFITPTISLSFLLSLTFWEAALVGEDVL